MHYSVISDIIMSNALRDYFPLGIVQWKMIAQHPQHDNNSYQPEYVLIRMRALIAANRCAIELPSQRALGVDKRSYHE